MSSTDFLRNCIPVYKMIRDIISPQKPSAYRVNLWFELLSESFMPRIVITDDKESARLLIPSESTATYGISIPMEIFAEARTTFEIMLKIAVRTMIPRRVRSGFSGELG